MKKFSVQVVLVLLALLCLNMPAAGFEIGAYLIAIDSNDHFNYSYSLMDLARMGSSRLIISGNVYSDEIFWVTLKNWGMTGVTHYNKLNDTAIVVGDKLVYPPNPTFDTAAKTQEIINDRNNYDNMTYMGQNVGDAMVGYSVQDEVECGAGLTSGQQAWLRSYCDLYKTYNPNRKTYINHCDPPWYDLHEGEAKCSSGCAIEYNHSRITSRTAEAQRLGFDGFSAVAQTARIADWMDSNCPNINYYGFGPCTEEQKNWLASRTKYEDVFDEVYTPYQYGAKGVYAFIYNAYELSTYSGLALVDPNGKDNGGARQGFSDGARAVRSAQGWPGVTLYRYVTPLHSTWMRLIDNRAYPAGSYTFSCDVSLSGGATLQKIIYGVSTMGGAQWNTIESTQYPYRATFTLTAGTKAIIRAQAVDSLGRKSIWAANVINVVPATNLQCGDYESALIAGDLNKDCIVNMEDIAAMASAWTGCDDPQRMECGTWDIQHQFSCGQAGSGYPGMAADLNGDCKVDAKDFSKLAVKWMACDNPAGCN